MHKCAESYAIVQAKLCLWSSGTHFLMQKNLLSIMCSHSLLPPCASVCANRKIAKIKLVLRYLLFCFLRFLWRRTIENPFCELRRLLKLISAGGRGRTTEGQGGRAAEAVWKYLIPSSSALSRTQLPLLN